MSSSDPSSGLGTASAPDAKRQRVDAAGDAQEAPALAVAMQAQIDASRAATQAQIETSRAATQAQMDALAAQVTARLDSLERTIEAGHTAMGAGARVILAKRVLLSPAEEVLAIPYLSQRPVMSFLRQEEALSLRAASGACRDAVAEHAWCDAYEPTDP